MHRCQRLILAASLLLSPVLAEVPSAAALPDGTVSIELEPDEEGASSHAAFVNAVGDVLGKQGMTVLEDAGHAAYVVRLKLTREEVGTGKAKVAPGKPEVMTGVMGVGAGVALPFSTGETRLVPLQRIRMEMRISKRGGDGTAWHGAAVTVRAAGTPKGTDATVATELSRALLSAYPAQPADVIAVP